MYDMVKNGERLRELRGEKRIRDVAKATGISEVLYGMYERGIRNPSDHNKVKLARFYGVSVVDLFFAEDTTNS